jgi:hypothetical protein
VSFPVGIFSGPSGELVFSDSSNQRVRRLFYVGAIVLGAPRPEDDCGLADVSGDRSDRAELADPYPVGDTDITWMAVDHEGNIGTCLLTVTVSPTATP